MKGYMEDPFLSEDFGVLRVSPIVEVLLALFGNEENYTILLYDLRNQIDQIQILLAS